MTSDETTLFDSYYDGRLADMDKKEFESRLAQEPALVKAYEEHVAVRKGLLALEMKEFEERLKSHDSEVLKVPTTSKYFSWKYMSAAAAIIIICLAGLQLYQSRSLDDTSTTYAAYYVTPISEISRGNQELDSYTQGVIHYERGAYDLALAALDKAEDTNRIDVEFWRGHTLYQLGRYDEASIAFANIITHNKASSSEKKDAGWMQVLSRLQGGESITSIAPTLKKISKDKSSQYAPWAQELLDNQ